MNKLLKRGLYLLLTLVLVSGAGFVIWAKQALGPEPAALEALQSDSLVTVTVKPEYTIFAPAKGQPVTALIFYPGGRVDYRSYAPPLRKIAEKGYLVILTPGRLNLAFLDLNAGEAPIEDFPTIRHWAIGGHSLGGVAATFFAANHPQVQGVVYWASYPGDDRLKNSGLKIMSIFGTQDALATPEKIAASKPLLPASTVFIPIDGGDHSGFGAYGFQPGDNPASIPAEAQWQAAADATSQLLGSLDN